MLHLVAGAAGDALSQRSLRRHQGDNLPLQWLEALRHSGPAQTDSPLAGGAVIRGADSHTRIGKHPAVGRTRCQQGIAQDCAAGAGVVELRKVDGGGAVVACCRAQATALHRKRGCRCRLRQDSARQRRNTQAHCRATKADLPLALAVEGAGDVHARAGQADIARRAGHQQRCLHSRCAGLQVDLAGGVADASHRQAKREAAAQRRIEAIERVYRACSRSGAAGLAGQQILHARSRTGVAGRQGTPAQHLARQRTRKADLVKLAVAG